jgi:hypothetical protein
MRTQSEGANVSKSLRFFVIFAFASILAFIPLLAFALPPIVPCGNVTGNICTPCHIVALAQRLLTFFVFVVVIMAALLFVNAGVLYLFSPASAANIAKAHRIFVHTLVGLVIVLASFLFIDTLMKTFYGDRAAGDLWGPWNNILCEGVGIPGPAPRAGGGEVSAEDPYVRPFILHVWHNYGCNISVNGARGAIRSLHEPGSVVQVTVTPFEGYSIVGWSDACAGRTGNTCSLAMNSDIRAGVTCAPIQ